MNNQRIYWIIIAILGIVHLQVLLEPAPIPIYVTIIIVLILGFILERRIFVSFLGLGKGWHLLLFSMQISLLMIYSFVNSTALYVITFALFIAIEWLRIGLSNTYSLHEKQLQNYEKEIAQMNETFRIVRSERHDFLKHISALHYMLENKQESEAKTYLDDLVEGYEETNLSIRGERGTVAAVLHQMYKRAKALGIEMIYDLDMPISSLPLSDQEMTTLLGNLLTNSLEACDEWQQQREKQATISLEFYKKSGLFIIVLNNKTVPVPNDVLDHIFYTYGKTTKTNDDEEHEGLGTKIIYDIVKKHQGYLDFVHKDEEFTVKIKIPAIR